VTMSKFLCFPTSKILKKFSSDLKFVEHANMDSKHVYLSHTIELTLYQYLHICSFVFKVWQSKPCVSKTSMDVSVDIPSIENDGNGAPRKEAMSILV
jgi:hypothetical protein